MKPDRSSRTAEYMAFFRACESVRPARLRLFSDPFAVHFLRSSLRAAVWCSRLPVLDAVTRWYADRRLPGARTSGIARTRLIDEVLSEGLRDRIHQIVILGAGFDCRAYRLPAMGSASVFEVDHPATLAWKLACLRRALPTRPQNIHYVPIDFNRDNLPQLLAAAGFDPSVPAAFLWEGVTNYLTSSAVDAVLLYVSSCSPGSRLIFTYVHSGALDASVYFEGAADLLLDVEKVGEPWTFGLHPAVVPDFLRERGLALDRDASAHEYRAQFYGTKALRMKGYDFYHVAIAHVPGKEEQSVAAVEGRMTGRAHA
jgi:methyltransferase (TIGR00027 family)